MPNGDFEKQLAEWERKTQLYREQVKTAQAQIETQASMVESLSQPVPLSLWERIGIAIFPPYPLISQIKSLPVAAGRRQQLATARNSLLETTNALEKGDFFARLYSEVPIAISEGLVSSSDDVLTLLKPPDTLTLDELSSVKDTISGMISTLTREPGVVPVPPEEMEYPPIVAPAVVTVKPIGIHAITTQEIIKMLKAPEIPESAMTKAEWEEYLKMKGYDENDIDKEQQILAEELIASWQDRSSQMEAFKSGIAEMPEYTLVDMLKQMTTQPGLAVMELAMTYFEHVSMPLAGKLYKNFIPDIEAEYQRFKVANPNATDREALVHAWIAWDAPFEGVAEWMLKYMLMEGLVDPLTYVGWGIAARLTKPIPYIGRLVGAAERGAATVFELPFDLVKYGWSRIPKTIAQRATVAQHQAGQYVERYITKATGKPLSSINMKEFKDVAERAVKYALDNPQLEDDIALAGREMLKHTPVDEALTRDWATRLNTTLMPEDITRVTVESLENLFEDMFSKKLITPREAAGQLLKVLHIGDASEVALKAAQRLLETRGARIMSRSLTFADAKTPLAAMRNLMTKNFRAHVVTEESVAALARKEAGAYTTLIHNLDLKLQGIWRDKVDRFIVRPFAEAYLTFGMYGPMNVLEDYIRSSLGHVIPRRMTVENWEKLTIGLSVDPELKRFGMSEMIGPLAREGADATHNNWILQLAALGQRGWSEKIYTTLVRLPGAYGMDIRRNFIGKKYLQLMADRGGTTFETLAKTGPKLPRLADRKLIKELEAETYRLKTTGNLDAIRNAKDLFTRERIMASEVTDIYKEHPEIPRFVRDDTVQAFRDGSLFARGGESIDEHMAGEVNKVLDNFIRGPEMASQEFHQLADFLTALEVRNPQEMATAIQAVYKMSEIHGALPDQIIARATERSRGLPLAERRATFDADFDRIYQFLDAAGADIDRVVDRLKVGVTAPAKLNVVEWDKVVFDPNLIKYGYRERIMEMVDKLPVEIKFDLREIAIRPQKVRTGVNAWYDTDAKSIFFTDVEHIKPQTFYHEIAHHQVMSKIADGDFEPIISYAKALGEEREARAIMEAAITDPMESYRTFTSVHETFARDFSDWCSTGTVYGPTDAIKAAKKTYFEDYFPRKAAEIQFSSSYKDAATRLFDVMTAKREYATEFRAQNMATRSEIFRGVGKRELKTPEFWDNFYLQMQGEYRILNLRMAELDGQLVRTLEDVNRAAGAKLAARTPIVVKDRPLAPQDIASLLGVRGDDISRALLDVLTVQNNKDFFVAYVRGMTRTGDIGFTKEAVEAVYDQIAYSLRVSPESMSWITGKQMELEAARRDLHSLYNSKMLPDEEITAIGKYLDDTAKAVEDLMYTVKPPIKGKPPVRVLKEEYKDFDSLRQSAMDEAHKWYYKEYPDYTNANAFDALMKSIYPYWTYESQRWFWLPRAFVRHPGLFTTFERWQNNSDYGYVHIPNTSVDINPFRGTIFGTLTTRLTRRDFPEYYDSLGAGKGLVEFNDYLSRFGFYPGAHIGIPLAMMGGLEQQMGETVPSIWKTPLNALIAARPEDESVKWLSEHIFSDRFREYMTILEVNKRGYRGAHIWTKIKEEIELTEEEQSVWDSARQEAAIHGVFFEQFGLFRLRTEEQYKAYEESSKIIEELTGYTPEQQDWLRRHGYRIWDMVGGLSPTNQAILQELESYKWLGTVTPLLPSRQQLELRKLDLDWDEVMRYTEDTLQTKLQLQQDFLVGRLSPADYNDRLQTLYADQRTYIDSKVEANPNMTLEGRKEYYKKYGIPTPVQHPMRELLNLYFSVELKDKVDEETGQLIVDWDTFFAQRMAIEDAIPEELKDEWEDYLTRNSTRIEEIRRDVYAKYFRKYYDVWEATLSGYPAEEQKLIKEYLYLEQTRQKLARQEEIRAMVSAKTNRQLVSSFRTDISDNRQALRYANPTLDAWLYFWGRTTSFQTPEAETIYYQLARDTGKTV